MPVNSNEDILHSSLVATVSVNNCESYISTDEAQCDKYFELSHK